MLTIPAGLFLALGLSGQEKKEDLIRVSGHVKVIYKDKSSFDLTVSNAGATRTVYYTPETRFTYRNGPGNAEDLKEGLRVICLGKTTGDRYVAQRIDLREVSK
jgi:hypothetical protein